MSKKLIVEADGSQSYVDTTPEEDAQAVIDADASVAAGQIAIAEAVRKAGLSSDANVATLLLQAKSASSAQIDTWLANNVTTLAQARAVLGALIKIVAVRLG